MLKKLSLLIVVTSCTLWCMEDEKNETLTSCLSQEQPLNLPGEVIDNILYTHMLAHTKTPRQFIECLYDLITNWRLAIKSFNLTKERLLIQIKKTTETKGLNFLERAVFKAIFLDYLTITSWLYHSLEPDNSYSAACLLKPLILNKFSSTSMHQSSDKLIGLAYYRLIKIETESIEDIKTLTHILFFVLKYADPILEDIKEELINHSAITLQKIAYGSGSNLAKKSTEKSLILIRFFAKICALDYISLNDIEDLWDPFFSEYKKRSFDNNCLSQYSKNKHSWMVSCIEADQSIKNLLKAKYQDFKNNPHKNSLATLIKKSAILKNDISKTPEVLKNHAEIDTVNTCILH